MAKDNQFFRFSKGFIRLNENGRSYIEVIIKQFYMIECSRPRSVEFPGKHQKQQEGG
jgi:hypothetical protein